MTKRAKTASNAARKAWASRRAHYSKRALARMLTAAAEKSWATRRKHARAAA